MKRDLWLGIGASLVILAACRPNEEVGAAANADNGVENGANQAVSGATPVRTAADNFAAEVARSDLYEIESGEMAAERATSAEVKSFAQMLIADHKKSTADLKAAVSSIDPPIAINPVLDEEMLAMVDALKNSSERDFDKAFIDQQKQAHLKALDMLRNYQMAGDNQALKDFAGKAAVVVQDHLDKLDAMRPQP